MVNATDFLETIQVRTSAAGQPITQRVKTELLGTAEAVIEHPWPEPDCERSLGEILTT